VTAVFDLELVLDVRLQFVNEYSLDVVGRVALG